MFYVYIIADPRNESVFYVGKGKGTRIYSHLLPCNLKGNSPLSKKLNEILSLGLEPILVKIFENLDNSEALELEKRLVRIMGLENLTNQCSGGGKGNIGYKHTDEARLKMSMAKRGSKNRLWGKERSKKTKHKISVANRGKERPDARIRMLENNPAKFNCKEWIVTDPYGNSMKIKNLKNFCDINSLRYSCMLDIIGGRQKTHKGGWRVKKC